MLEVRNLETGYGETQIIILRRYLDLSMKEIREELELPSAGATRMLLSRAQVHLAELLAKDMDPR